MNELSALEESNLTVFKTGLVFDSDMTFDKWYNLGKQLKVIKGAIQWWIGDWLNYGERSYGEKYAQALDQTEYDYQTLADFKWVASQFEVSQRNENLSWNHHRLIAPLEDKKEWLDKAEKDKLSTRDLKALIKGSEKCLHEQTEIKEIEVCKDCGKEIK